MGVATDILTMGGSKLADTLAKRGSSSDNSDSSDSTPSSRLKAVSQDEYTDDPGVAPGYRKRRTPKRQ